ncbi:uncharacterized protein MELLADRAFT_88518 [Melampsora larici-populina 98AG31]|uniref:GCM domain-containing protein n=1 Tax=Melampsora larici-populina (strain 98AG31 / pathotype 3-4-7) TaxID=747676 RepID=F4RS09_MELLP|nr:uncharacterized protein MELLADRAFT_88518 [Melampsora larici-populina 98AG31]EGG04860.1 hypothetical protein MELLADRAFT_88518 [Melampsora larici-populina 98AG31]
MSLVILRKEAPGLLDGSPQPIPPLDMAKFILSDLAVPTTPQSYDSDSRVPISIYNCHQVFQLYRSYQFSQLAYYYWLFPLDHARSVSPPPEEVLPLATQSDAHSIVTVTHVSETPQPTPTKLKRRPPKKTGKKFKLPVPASGELVTFIDHGTTRDPQGYPLYPNGETVFVRKPHDDITNFGHVAYTHTQKTKGTKDGPWKTIWYACLGVLRCDDDFCAYAAPPPTAEGKAAEYIKDGTHIWTQCPGTVCRIDIQKDTGWGVLRHSGFHAHPWPASKKADPLAMLDLTQEVVKNPKAGPLVLKVLVEKGLIPEKESKGGGDRLIMDLMHWGNHGLRLISTSLLGANVHITFQTDWMADQLVRRDTLGKVYSGGLLSDVTYRFFHHGYLLTTSMYSEILHRWIPIQLTWMWGLEEAHYKAHFLTLLAQINAADLTYHERDLLVQQVVDFSTAQKKGFVSAYMEVFHENDPGKALSKLKGCHEHYRQSITRFKKNCNVVAAGRLAEFESLALDLLEPNKPGDLTLTDKFAQIARLFPKAKPWIDWWNTADIHSMLFCARDRLPMDDPPLPEGEDPHDYPDTTNGQESMHCQYYILTSGHCTIIQGFIQLLLFAESLKRDFNNVLRGISVKYGNSWESVVETMGWSKERTRRRPEVNVGRPPDTTEALIRPKKLGRPTGSSNVNRDPHSSYQSYTASTEPGIEGQSGEGLFSNNLRCCTTCCTDRNSTSTDADVDEGSDRVTVGKLNEGDDIPRLYERSRLDFTGQPMNVYFHLRGVAGLTEEDRISFMGEMDWPATLVLNDVSYEIVSRGFWGYHHYWSKVVRYVDGVRGVWFYDDRKDDGRAQLLGRDLSSISGAQPSTTKITSKNPDAQGDLPFVSQPDLDDVEEIEEDLPDLPELDAPLKTLASGVGTSQPSSHVAKVAFTSAASPAVEELEELETTVPTVGSQAVSHSDKAKQAFIRAQNCPSSSAPPSVMRREEGKEDNDPVPASLPEEPKANVKGPLNVRLRVNKRPKSQSPSPQKVPKVKKGAAKDKKALQAVKEEDLEEKGKAKPKLKGRKKK